MGGWIRRGLVIAMLAIGGVALPGCNQAADTAAPAAQAEAAPAPEIAGVASVVDGDTIEIRGVRIRLSGFDTPERGKRCGEVNVYQRAANELDSFLEGRTVHCTRRGTNQHGRAVATCSAGGVDVGDSTWSAVAGDATGRGTAAARTLTRKRGRAPRHAGFGGCSVRRICGATAITRRDRWDVRGNRSEYK